MKLEWKEQRNLLWFSYQEKIGEKEEVALLGMHASCQKHPSLSHVLSFGEIYRVAGRFEVERQALNVVIIAVFVSEIDITVWQEKLYVFI